MESTEGALEFPVGDGDDSSFPSPETPGHPKGMTLKTTKNVDEDNTLSTRPKTGVEEIIVGPLNFFVLFVLIHFF